MNILFIEDEKELAATGAAQLELKGYTVFSAHDIAEAKAVLEDASRPIHFVIADHRLPDGMGIDLVIDLKESRPRCKCAVVSGCLTDKDIENLEAHQIPYYHKPLLYAKVIDGLRRMHAAMAPYRAEPEPESTDPTDGSKKSTGARFWPFNSRR